MLLEVLVLVLSLRPGVALNHPHYSHTTPAVEVRESSGETRANHLRHLVLCLVPGERYVGS